ncbi:MmgE/PrpD family protein [Nocardioides halotolerans]|uniref:MmgE/PrpD family protein n=1 Tax=Nocardioides halotolerans TaxID=433660 RepID=UPI00040ACB04|nr:MmgE/PrpD family protein [Nocardioides halotolerans]
MDRTTERLVEFALDYRLAAEPERVHTATLHHLIDTVAVAVAGTTAEPARMAARVATRSRRTPGATVVGSGGDVAPDQAAFANSVIVRTYDWNDGMQAKGGGHPSDMIPGLLAIGEIALASGAELLSATALAYELLGGLGIAVSRAHFDQGLFMGGATALACGRLLGLDREQLGHAVSLALTTALPLAVHRWGSLTMMKGASTAFAVRNAVHCTELAAEGFTATAAPVEGFFGLWEALGEFEPQLPVLPGGPSVIEMAHQKPIPAESQVLGLLDIVPRVRAWSPADRIESIHVEVCERASRHVADADKYDPQTRETADHSLPYMLAVALVDGEITLDSYRPERFLDPALRPLMRRITVAAADDLTELRDQNMGVTKPHPVRVVFRDVDGRELREETMYHKGHFQDPMTAADIDAKFDRACQGLVEGAALTTLKRAWWEVGSADDVAVPMSLLAHVGAADDGRPTRKEDR